MVSFPEAPFYLDGYLKSNYDILLEKAIPNKWDAVIVIWGIEGSGKSTFTAQGCKYMDPRMTLKNTAWLPDQFRQVVTECPPESSIWWDEAITAAGAMSQATNVSKGVVSELTQIRKKRLKIFVCFPYLFMLGRYFVSRCSCSIRIYAKAYDDRGYFCFYDSKKTQELYYLMKEKYASCPDHALRVVWPNFYGRFTNNFPFDEEEYDRLKEEARLRQSESENKPKDLWKLRALQTVKHFGINQTEVAKLWGVTRSTVTHAITESSVGYKNIPQLGSKKRGKYEIETEDDPLLAEE